LKADLETIKHTQGEIASQLQKERDSLRKEVDRIMSEKKSLAKELAAANRHIDLVAREIQMRST
jgi:hypothetical protein